MDGNQRAYREVPRLTQCLLRYHGRRPYGRTSTVRQRDLPGFVDPHNHFAVGVFEGEWTDCRSLTSIPAVQTALRAAAAAMPAGEWLRAVGYHHAQLAERRHPTRAELDEAVLDRPAFLLYFSHHQGVANSRALAAGRPGNFRRPRRL